MRVHSHHAHMQIQNLRKTGIFQAKIGRCWLNLPLGGGEVRQPVDHVIWTIKSFLGPTPCPAPITAIPPLPHVIAT